MASTKRVRTDDEGRESEEAVEIAAASSSFTSSRGKRQRIAVLGSDDEESLNGGPVGAGRSRLSTTIGLTEGEESGDELEAASSELDLGSEELRSEPNEDEDDLRATQLIKRSFTVRTTNHAAQIGIIEQVICRNFMCHKSLDVKLGPHINFIIGHNGSGKSAVLTALTLCLGGKATSTNRGQNLKSFIKEGEESAMLSVRIKNQGEYGYMTDLYGPSIIVERHFSRGGVSGFKIKNSDGRIVSIKRSDLEEICDVFALQLDNPINVLTQDMARQFLNSSSPADKYKLFNKGTQLEELDHHYQLLAESVDNQEIKLKTVSDDMTLLKDKSDRAEEKRQRAARHESINDRIREARRQMAWAQVEEQERFQAELVEELQKSERKVADLSEAAEKVAEEYESAVQAKEQAHAELEELRETIKPHQEKKAELREQYESNRRQLMETQTQQRSIQQELKRAKNEVRRTKQDIEAERQRLENAHGGDHTRRLEEIEEAKARCEELVAEQREHGDGLAPLLRAKDESSAKWREAKPEVDQRRDEVGKCEGVLRDLQANRGHNENAYHPKMPQLLKAIQNERKFNEKPVGPVGTHIRLKPSHASWSSILERTCGGMLNSFLVTSRQDQTVLSDLAKRVGCPCEMFIGTANPIDTTGKEPTSDVDTIMRILEIDNALVRNQLIINQAIEQVVLIRDRQEANAFMDTRPTNVKATLCFHDTIRNQGIRLSASRFGSKADPVRAWTDRPRIKTDNATQVNLQREQLQQVKKDLAAAEARRNELERTARKAEQDVGRHRKMEKDLRLRVQQAQELVEKLQDELEQSTPQDGRLDALEQQLQEFQEEDKIQSNAYQDAVNEKDKFNESEAELKSQMSEIDKAMEEITMSVDKAERHVLKLDDKRTRALYNKNNALERIEDAESDTQRYIERRDDQAERVADFERQATGISARVAVPPGATMNSLEKKLGKLVDDRTKVRNELGGSYEEIALQARDALRGYKQAVKRLKRETRIGSDLKSSLVNRRDRLDKFRRFISSRARANFLYLLSERAFRGSLEIDHRAKLLDLHVEPDITRASDKGRQTKTLSGGEKSFSTICLLLSIWEAMGSPIRCLDEFDVFMDNVNRDISMKMMIDAARRSRGRQFILISPQAMSGFLHAPDIKVHKMRDPERGQQTLSF